ncbi:MAG TPA: hypothetical protein VGI48_09415 [Caldimonas sp.]|jgi:hypothetical protein
MKPTAATTFSAWLRRFARWFFTSNPEAVADPAPVAREKGRRTKRGKRALSRLRAHHAGRIQFSDRKRS